MSDTILVVGGTGMLGEPVARRLASSGYTVRVLTRNKGRAEQQFGAPFEIAEGDVRDPVALAAALKGCTGVHLSLDGRGDWEVERRGAENVARLARELGLARITLISGASTCKDNCWFPMTRAKFDAENAVRESGVPFTILRCTIFMEALPNFVRDGKAIVMGKQPTPWHWLAASDYARMAARAHETPASAGTTLYVYGPEALLLEEALERYRSVCAPDSRVVRAPFWMLSAIARLPGRRELRDVGLPLMRYFSKVRELGDPAEADTLLGKPTTTLEDWCRARAKPTGAAEAPTPASGH